MLLPPEPHHQACECCLVFKGIYLFLSAYVLTGAHGGQKRTTDPLKLGFHEVVSYPVQILGPELSPLQEQQVLLPT